MKTLLIIFSSFILLSCGNPKADRLQKELNVLKQKIKLTKVDSIKIYHSINKRQTKKEVNKYLDSLEKNDKSKYIILIDECNSRKPLSIEWE